MRSLPRLIALVSLLSVSPVVYGDGAPRQTESDAPKAEACHVEENLIKLTNNQRRAAGLPPLEVDTDLVQSARQHAKLMAAYHSLHHTSRPVAENIAMGQRGTRQAITSWMSSPGHRANILNPSYTRIGVAWAAAPDGTFYWCQQFLQ